MLQERKKWNKTRGNLAIGDIVLLADETLSRCQWPLARILEVIPCQDGLVRKVRVRVKNSVFDRPIHNLVHILSGESQTGSRDEETDS